MRETPTTPRACTRRQDGSHARYFLPRNRNTYTPVSVGRAAASPHEPSIFARAQGSTSRTTCNIDAPTFRSPYGRPTNICGQAEGRNNGLAARVTLEGDEPLLLCRSASAGGPARRQSGKRAPGPMTARGDRPRRSRVQPANGHERTKKNPTLC